MATTKLKGKEIAQKLGISPATLSLIANNKPGISEETRKKVIEQLVERGYDYILSEDVISPKPREDTIKNIGFVIYRETGDLLENNSFFPLMMDGMEFAARAHGYGLNYINIYKNTLDADLKYLSDSGCSGYVLFGTEMHRSDLERFRKLDIPFVILDNCFRGSEISCVTVGNEEGIYAAVKYLVERGHSKIGYLKSGVDIDSFKERFQYAVFAARDIGAEAVEDYTWTVGYPSETALEGMAELLKKHPKLPTAFLADNDLVSVGAMRAVLNAGLRVPEDISFIGYDDRPICSMTEPPLTSVRLPRNAFGGEAVELIIRLIEGHVRGTVKTEVYCDIAERKSVADLKLTGNYIIETKAYADQLI